MKAAVIPLTIAGVIAAMLGGCDDSGPTRPSTSSAPIPRFATLTGLVTEPVGVPVVDAAVTVVDGPSKGQSSPTGVDGRYVLSVSAGVLSIEIRKDGYASVTRQVVVPETRTLDVEITPLPAKKINGKWSVTFEASAQCSGFPADARVRSYQATITQQGKGTEIALELSGAKFATTPRFSGTNEGGGVSISLTSPPGCWYCYYEPDPAIIEELGEDRFVGISGTILATVSGSKITGVLRGDFMVMETAKQPFKIQTSCSNEEHRVTFNRQ
jgi:hypothetical protein